MSHNQKKMYLILKHKDDRYVNTQSLSVLAVGEKLV